MAWIESHQDIQRHPKTTRLRRTLKVGLPTVVGHLHMFWWWALTFAENGDLSAIEDDIIAEESGWDGDASEFVAALVSAGWVNADRTIHDWDHYTGRIRKQREDNRVRQQRWRENNPPTPIATRIVTPHVTPNNALVTRDSPLHNPATGPDLTGPNPKEQDALVLELLGGLGGEEPAADAAAKPKRSSTAGKTKAPDALEPNAADYAAGSEVGLSKSEVDSKATAMLDHFRAKGEMRNDWHATLRTWLRNSQKFDGPRGSSNGHSRPPPRGPSRPPIPVTASAYLEGRNGRIPSR